MYVHACTSRPGQNALLKYSQTPEAAPFKSFYDTKLASNGAVLSIYTGSAPPSTTQAFFAHSRAHWQHIVEFLTVRLPAVLPERGFLGGAQPGEDDFHLGAWIARIAFLLGGSQDKDGCKAFEKETKQAPDPKLAAYWAAWSERASWKTVYASGLH